MRIPRATNDSSSGQNGIVVDLTMQGDGVYDCVYTVPASVGSSQRPFLLQVDTGSADLWLASTSCSSKPSCSSFDGPKYDASSATTQTDQQFGVIYRSGVVGGPIVADKFQVGGYTINGQALAAASDIQNEDLTTGAGFSGLIGLAPQADSVIATTLNKSASTSTPSVSGSTFSTNLFSNPSGSSGISSSGPSTHFISLLLERPFYPTIPSRLGLGAHPQLPYSLSPEHIQYSAIMASNPGPLYWRVPMTAVTVLVKGAQISIPLGASVASGISSIWPVVVFDSAETSMTSTRSFANAFYGAWDIGPGSEDGQYYVPCSLTMNVTLTLGQAISIQVPLHPLDMSVTIQLQPDSDMCLGTLQATDSSIAQGDLILGTPFLRNVYTVMSYQSNPPQLGILPLTNTTTALDEFNTVRVLRKPIGNGLSPSQQAAGYTSSFSGSGQVLSIGDNDGNKGVKLGLTILGGILGFLVLAGGLLWLSVRFLGKRLMQRGAPRAAVDGDGGGRRNLLTYGSEAYALSTEKLSRKQQQGLTYDGEEAFAMFSGAGARSTPMVDEVTDIANASEDRRKSQDSDATTIVDPSASRDPFRRNSHRQQSSDSSNAFTLGIARDSRYPTIHAHSHSAHSGMPSSSAQLEEEDIGAPGYLRRD
ncbi:hypothetical protein FRB95_013887 [Tulasnella sp. JGI-2019a]|nr:hypothetical protein FRB95_013887 [Tulasnella sp. JGI-2019a]